MWDEVDAAIDRIQEPIEASLNARAEETQYG